MPTPETNTVAEGLTIKTLANQQLKQELNTVLETFHLSLLHTMSIQEPSQEIKKEIKSKITNKEVLKCFGHGTMIISFEENNKEKKLDITKTTHENNPLAK